MEVTAQRVGDNRGTLDRGFRQIGPLNEEPFPS